MPALITKILGTLFFVPTFIFIFTFLFGKFYLPVSYGKMVCAKATRPSCFIGLAPCIKYQNLCTIPPLWYSHK